MTDSDLWAVALGVGVLGLVLVLVAAIAALTADARARRSREAQVRSESQPEAADPVEPRVGGGGWLWLKAGVFAFIHAGAVSFVLGGLTFFEDIARANEEIRTTGAVTFPKRLLPKTLVGPDANLPIGRSGDGATESRGQPASPAIPAPPNRAPSAPAVSASADWEVVDVVPEERVG